MDAKRKKVYQPPQVTKVTLRPEEAVLASCKTSSGGGPVGHCNPTPGTCNAQGS